MRRVQGNNFSDTPRRPQSAAAGAATSRSGVAAAAFFTSTVAPDATSVQWGGSGGYCVPFFCGRDEHSTASAARPPPDSEGKKPTE